MEKLPPEHCGPWMQTYSGCVVDLLNPDPHTINIRDIAHHLAYLCRYTGATPDHYSVAQHCIYTSRLVPRDLARAGLLHDAAEAYVSDVSRPLKIAMREISEGDGRVFPDSPYDEIAQRFERAIADKFNLGDTLDHAEIKRADLIMLATEARDLGFLEKAFRSWNLPLPPADFLLIPMAARRAEELFLEEYERLFVI